MRSSKSTVSGKKSVPGRGSRAMVAVASTMVSPYCTVTEPLACVASVPDSMVRVRPPHSMETDSCCNAMMFSKNIPVRSYGNAGAETSQAPVPKQKAATPAARCANATALDNEYSECDSEKGVAAGALAANAQLLNDGAITRDILILYVAQHAAARTDQDAAGPDGSHDLCDAS
jgi:hypothetical protein